LLTEVFTGKTDPFFVTHTDGLEDLDKIWWRQDADQQRVLENTQDPLSMSYSYKKGLAERPAGLQGGVWFI
jgi:hypothetical protein